MDSNEFSLNETVAIIFITGFAVQQLLQILDPFVAALISNYKNSRPNRELPGKLSEADFKKALMAFLSFSFGAITVALTGIKLLHYIRPEWGGKLGDFLVTAFVIGSGTEAANTVLKFIGYAKDNQKPSTSIKVTIFPNPATVAKKTTLQFQADVENSTNRDVEWAVLHGNGGSIDEQTGLYTAPDVLGKFQVIAVSRADSTKHGIADVTVS